MHPSVFLIRRKNSKKKSAHLYVSTLIIIFLLFGFKKWNLKYFTFRKLCGMKIVFYFLLHDVESLLKLLSNDYSIMLLKWQNYEEKRRMKFIRSDLGASCSALPFVLCYKIPNERNQLLARLLKLEAERMHTHLLREIRKVKLSNETTERNERIRKLEDEIQRSMRRTYKLYAPRHECRSRSLMSSSDRFAVEHMIERARKAIKK